MPHLILGTVEYRHCFAVCIVFLFVIQIFFDASMEWIRSFGVHIQYVIKYFAALLCVVYFFFDVGLTRSLASYFICWLSVHL